MTCVVTSISWERVHVSLTATLHECTEVPASIQFTIVDGGRAYPVNTTPAGDGQYRLEINVTNFRDRRQVPDGTWRIVPYIDGEPGPAATYDLNTLTELDEASRTFLYAANRVAYVVSFGISEDEQPHLVMRTYQMFRNPKSRGRGPKRSLRRRLLDWLLPRHRRVTVANRVYRIARALRPPRGNRILFASEMRTGMEGNLARVHERMIQRGLDSRYTFRYSFRVPRIATKQTTLRTIYLLATSDIVMIDDYFGLLETLRVSPQTRIIQLWHAGSGFKAVGYSRFGTYGSPKLRNAHRAYTYAITGSKHLVPVYAEAFGIEESAVIPTGLPRVDTFLDPARTEKVVSDFFTEYPHLQGKRIILFAPTFRGRSIHDAYYDYSRVDLPALYDLCHQLDAVVLFRMHHFVQDPVPIPVEYADRLLDFSSFPETNDLLHVTDVLITDYSSVIYEFSLLRRPMLFYAYDKAAYAATRGFHRDLDAAAPGRVCESFEALISALRNEDYEIWKVDQFRQENFDWLDTGSADRVIDWLVLGDPQAEAEREAHTRTPEAQPA